MQAGPPAITTMWLYRKCHSVKRGPSAWLLSRILICIVRCLSVNVFKAFILHRFPFLPLLQCCISNVRGKAYPIPIKTTFSGRLFPLFLLSFALITFGSRIPEFLINNLFLQLFLYPCVILKQGGEWLGPKGCLRFCSLLYLPLLGFFEKESIFFPLQNGSA